MKSLEVNRYAVRNKMCLPTIVNKFVVVSATTTVLIVDFRLCKVKSILKSHCVVCFNNLFSPWNCVQLVPFYVRFVLHFHFQCFIYLGSRYILETQ